MDSNTHQTVEINLRDLFFVVLKKLGIISLVGIILAGALFAYKYISSSNDANVLDVSAKLDGETDIEYSDRVKNVNHAEDIINSIEVLNNQIDSQRVYVADSILMQIDTEKEAVTTASFLISVDDNLTTGLDNALALSYEQDIETGEYLNGLADELGTKQGYLVELIKADTSSSDSVVVNTSGEFGSAGILKITVIGPSTDYTDKIMDEILEEINVKSVELNASMAPHTITLSARQSSYIVDNTTRDLQYSVTSRFETLQKQIDSYDDSLDDIASDLGVDNKDSLYKYFTYNDDSWSGSALGSAIKFAVIGFVIGAFLVACVIVIDYIFGKKFSTQSKFFSRFPGINKIGVAKPAKKGSAYAKAIDIKTGDDNHLSDENSVKLMSANVKNLTSGMDKVLFTGTADAEKVKELVKALNIKADVKASIFEDPSCLESIADYDGIILVEQRDYSDRKLIAEELELISNADTKLIGAIVL
jgi:hypothetical protein